MKQAFIHAMIWTGARLELRDGVLVAEDGRVGIMVERGCTVAIMTDSPFDSIHKL